ncbi:MAG: hypothetical protein QG597_1536 [Actinomycetota bacterium]|nr:hypothetical protein [Actinomycetota bacterium]
MVPVVFDRPRLIDLRARTTIGPPSDYPRLWSRLNRVACVLAVVPTSLRVLGSLRHNGGWDYSAVEWLINNGGGLTRRGLSGDLLLAVPGLTARTVLVITVMALLAVVTAGYAALVGGAVRATGTGWPLLFWLLPGGLVMGTLQANLHGITIGTSDFALRKDYLFLAILIGTVVAAHRWPQSTPRLVIAGAGAVACGLGVFIHEALAVGTCGVLIYLMVWLNPRPLPRTITMSLPNYLSAISTQVTLPTGLVIAAPTLVGLGLLAGSWAPADTDMHVMWTTVDATTRSWVEIQTLQVGGIDTGLPPAIWWLTASPAESLHWIQAQYLDTGVWVAWAITAGGVTGWVLVAGRLVDSSPAATRRNLVHLGILAAATLPLFVFALDWGRWIVGIGLVACILLLAGLQDPRYRPTPASFGVVSGLTAAGLVGTSLVLAIPVFGIDFWLARLFI